MKEIKLNKLKETIYYDKCSNGLEIYMWINEKVENYYATLNVKYGSCDTKFKVKDKEYKVTNGIAHFLEHINFNESDGTTANNYFDKKGTSTNAFTTFDYTSYEVYGSNDILGDVSHLLDFVQDKYITSDMVENEKGIIVEEVKMGSNNPGHKMFYEVNKAIYNNDCRRNEITGTVKDVNKISSQELELVYDNFYIPSNMFLIITGNFNPYELSAMIKEKESKRKSKEVSVKKICDKEDIKVNENFKELKGNIEIPKISINYKMNRKKFKEYNNKLLKIYLNIIMGANFGSTSNLKEDLMEKELIYAMGVNTQINKDIVVISIDAETKYPEELKNIIEENMKKLSLTDERLIRKIKCSIADIISGLDDIEFVNSFIQTELINYNKINNNIYDIFKSLNMDDANNILKHIDLNNEAIVVMMAEKK